MRTTEVQQLLEMISALSTRTFPTGAADVWRKVLHDVDPDDAEKAVIEIFMQPEAYPSTQLPGAVRRIALRIKDQREAAGRRALTAQAAAAPPNETYLAFRAELARRLGARSAQPTRVMAPDTASPTLTESEITEDRRAAELRRLASWAA